MNTITNIVYDKIGYNKPQQANWSYEVVLLIIQYKNDNDNKIRTEYAITYHAFGIDHIFSQLKIKKVIKDNVKYNRIFITLKSIDNKISLKKTAGSTHEFIKEFTTRNY